MRFVVTIKIVTYSVAKLFWIIMKTEAKGFITVNAKGVMLFEIICMGQKRY